MTIVSCQIGLFHVLKCFSFHLNLRTRHHAQCRADGGLNGD